MLMSGKALSASQSALINSYVDGNLEEAKRLQVEALIASSDEAASLLRSKTESKSILLSKIPNKKLSKQSLSLLRSELREVSEDLFPEEKPSIGQRLAKILDSTIFEF